MQRNIAKLQYKISPQDLETILALVRTGTLAAAGERLGIDASTVFRNVQKMEKGLGQRLFERSRSGYLPSDLTRDLASHAEQVEAQLEAARSATQAGAGQVSGSVRITTTDSILHGLVAPVLKQLRAEHPLLNLDLNTGNELANLVRREADIAVRVTRKPPQHLVGKRLGPIQVAVFAARGAGMKKWDEEVAAKANWIAVDDALPEHPSVIWRKKALPKVYPAYRVSSILTVSDLVARGLGLGVLPLFLARHRRDLVQLTDALDDAQTDLWLLTHVESRHLRRVSTVFGCLAKSISMP